MPSAGTRAFLAYWLPAVFWMGVIFLMSTGLGAGENTSRILGPLLKFLFPEVSGETIAALRLVVRKFAHVVEYAILASLIWRALAQPQGLKQPWNWNVVAQTFVICLLYAASDEFHQTFVDGRVGTATDVMIDSIGIGAALAALWIWHGRVHRSGKPLG